MDDYEKALDLAVEQINKSKDSGCPKGKDCLKDGWIGESNCNKCWKDYLLKEASKENEQKSR